MTQSFKATLLIIIVLFSLTSVTFAEGLNVEDINNKLYYDELVKLNVFDENINLDEEVTRIDGIMTLFRLIENAEATDEEKEIIDNNKIETEKSIENTNITPFTDVPDWAVNEVNYLYQEGIINGVSETKLGSNKKMNTEEFTTLILRIIGYREEDFSWKESIEKATEIGLLPLDKKNILKELTFSKGIMSYIIYSTIDIKQ